MQKAKYAAVLAVVLAFGATLAASAQEEAGTTAARQVIEMPVRQYKTLSPSHVYRTATEGHQADARFRDAFVARTVVPDAVSQITLRRRSYQVVLAFRTQADLVCLVPQSSVEALKVLFGLPRDWPVTPAALSRPIVLNEGQQITIEGTIVGTAVGEKYVLVDAVLLGAEQRRPTRRDVQLLWATQAEPRVMTEPGTKAFIFPCSYVEGETESVKLTVKALSPEGLMAELARLAGEQEAMPGGPKTYGQYTAGAVYRHAGDNNRINVDFTDTIAAVQRGALPDALATAPTLLGGLQVQVPVARAFETASRVTCLAPATSPTLSSQAARALAGEKVRIRGTVIGPRGAYNCVLVDYIGFPAEEEAAGDGQIWLVSLEYPGIRPRVFWDYGLHTLRDLPCQHARGRFEALRVLLREFRLITIEQPPARVEEPAKESD